MTGLVAAKLDDPGDDVLCALIEAHRVDPDGFGLDGFGLDGFAMLGAALLFAGTRARSRRSTPQWCRWSGVAGTHPAQRDTLRADPVPVPAAVEEILRSSLPGAQAPTEVGCSRGLARWTTADLDVDGVTIPIGDLVLLGLQQANDNPALVGERPGFDVARARTRT